MKMSSANEQFGPSLASGVGAGGLTRELLVQPPASFTPLMNSLEKPTMKLIARREIPAHEAHSGNSGCGMLPTISSSATVPAVSLNQSDHDAFGWGAKRVFWFWLMPYLVPPNTVSVFGYRGRHKPL